MDPLHPLVPIQPASPVPPDYTRIRRIERDQQREPEPEWQQSSEQDADKEQGDERFEDDYDPDWSDPAAAETGYNDHGLATDLPAGATDPAAGTGTPWDPRRQGERRARPRSGDDPEDQEPGPHIDIIA